MAKPLLLLGEPDSPAQRVEAAHQSFMLAGGAAGLAIIALVGSALQPTALGGFRPVPVAILSVGAVLAAIVVRARPDIMAPARMPWFLGAATLFIGLAPTSPARPPRATSRRCSSGSARRLPTFPFGRQSRSAR